MSLEPVPPLQSPQAPVEPYFIAMVINGVVHEVFNVNGNQAARYLAQPTFVQIDQAANMCNVGWLYDGTVFTPPAIASE